MVFDGEWDMRFLIEKLQVENPVVQCMTMTIVFCKPSMNSQVEYIYFWGVFICDYYLFVDSNKWIKCIRWHIVLMKWNRFDWK